MIFHVGACSVDTQTYEVRRSDRSVAIEPQVFDLLVLLLTNRDRVVTKDEIIEKIWNGRIVSDAALSSRIKTARKVVGDDGKAQSLIRTVQRRGFRFVGSVTVEDGGKDHEGQTETEISAGWISRQTIDVEAGRSKQDALAPEPDSTADPASYAPVPTRATRQLTLPWSGQSEPSAERRQLTMMFCDLVGSTALSATLDPEDMREIIRTYQAHVAEAVIRFGGSVARSATDGVMSYFGWPESKEEDAEGAVRAALGLVGAIGKGPIHGEMRHVRVGIATGFIVMGHANGAGEGRVPTAVGPTPGLATGLQGLAKPDCVLVDDATRRLIGDLFECRDLGPIAANGTLTRAWQVLSGLVVDSRFAAFHMGKLAPLVSRQDEVELLLRRWQQAKGGEGQVLLLAGEPGIGKSRLIAELEDRLCGDPHATQRFLCSPHYRQSALNPIVARLEQWMGFEPGDSPGNKVRKLEAVLLASRASTEDISLVGDLLAVAADNRYPILDLSLQRKKAKTFAAVTRLLVNAAREQPLLMVLEDAHWADPSSLEFLNAVIDLLPTRPILLVISFRPEFNAPWVGNANVTLMTLSRLNRRHAAQLVAQVAKERALMPRLIDRIVAQTDGVPLFIEELTKTMLEIASDPDVATRSAVVPTTLQASLMARLDRLPSAKQVAQIASVIGRDFSYALLATVAGLSKEELAHGLEQLVGAGLAIRRGAPPDAVYQFKHVLVQETAYESQLRKRRTELHAAIVTAAEADTTSTMEPGLLGYHCAQAGLIAKAASYYRIAGQQSAARSAAAETRIQLERGLQHAASMQLGPDRYRLECELLLALGHLLLTINGNADAEALAVFKRADVVCRKFSDPKALTRALFSQATILLHRGDSRTAQEISEELLKLGETRNNAQTLLAALVRAGHVACFQGRFTAARDDLSRALALRTQDEEVRLGAAVLSAPAVTATAHLALSLACLGYAEQATAQIETIVGRTRHIFPSSTTVALTILARHSDDALHESAKEQAALAEEQGFPYFLALARCLLGWLGARQGNSEGLGMLQGAVASLNSLEIKSHASWALGLMSDALVSAGRHTEAIARLDEALALSTQTGISWIDAELHRRKGELLFRTKADITRAEQSLGRAMFVAREQSAKLFELRAAMSQARLYHSTGRQVAGRKLLSPIYDWFTEGLELTDLRDTRRLLADLRGAS